MPRWTKAAVLGVVAALILAVVIDPGFLSGEGEVDGADLPVADGPAPVTSDTASQFTSDLAAGSTDAATDPGDATAVDDPNDALFAQIEANPDDPEGWIKLAGLLAEAGDYSRASEAYAAAVEAAPDHAEARAGLGKALLFMGLLRVARAELTRALELDPALAEAHLNLGITYSHSAPTDLDAARTAWTTVIELEPDTEVATQARAYLDSYASAGTDPEAVAAVDEANQDDE